MSERDFAGKVAVVTGAGSGIGAACARLLAERGAQVVIADVDLENAEKVAAEIGSDSIAVAVDVSDPQACDEMVQTAITTFGRLDVAVNNAGISGPQAPTGEYPLDGWAAVVGVNLSGGAGPGREAWFAEALATIGSSLGGGRS